MLAEKNDGEKLTILSVGYPFAPVRQDTAGGAEQVLAMLDSEIVRMGHVSIVIAPEGSRIKGIFVPVAEVEYPINERARQKAYEYCLNAINNAIRKWDVDVIHMHGLDFDRYLPPPGLPVVATLHLPLEWYSQNALRPDRPDTHLHCVSASQRKRCRHDAAFLPDIENGVDADRFRIRISKRNYAISLGRICPEKGFHIAMDASKKAKIPFMLAGRVFPYANHMKYFSDEIIPRIDMLRRFVGPAGFDRKRRLLSAARCLLAPSLAPETSSLVAIEALACGTPVVAFPAGALAEIIEHGRTGFLVKNSGEMAEAIHEAASLDPQACRDSVRKRFRADTMVRKYMDLYTMLAERKRLKSCMK